MNRFPVLQDSVSSPLHIAELQLGDGAGCLGLTICPGKKDSFKWNRDLEEDLRAILKWGASTAVTLIERHEFELLKISRLGERVQKLGMRWIHLPIRDVDVPDQRFERAWSIAGPEIHDRIQKGEKIVIHCRGGLGRTGLVAGLILVERGCDPRKAVQIVRATRPGAIETAAQEQYVLRANARAQAGHSRVPSKDKLGDSGEAPQTGGKRFGRESTPAGEIRKQRASTVHVDDDTLSRAEGCLLGQLAGDSLGSLVEFEAPNQIRRKYPDGVRELADGGTWGTIAGQPTDDSEMALMLARMLIKHRRYAQEEARKAYVFWLDSHPFDCGNTVSAGLHGRPNRDSQANGALMRISPLGIFCSRFDPERTAEYARQDAALTHPHPVCLQANTLFTMAIADAISRRKRPKKVYDDLKQRAIGMRVEKPLMNAILEAAESVPADYVHQQGWVLIAFQNALWQLLHAPTLEEGVVDTVMRGGDTDTNAAIAGALLGAVHGRDAIPNQWVQKILSCRPNSGTPGVRHPRPESFWPVDALQIARDLLEMS
jgi:ADP-ribosylglycohydrolase/protein-tyrosine phosphatase